MARVQAQSHEVSGHRSQHFLGGIMFKAIAKYAPAVAALGALTSGSFGVIAETTDTSANIRSVTVRYVDLDLNTPAGVEELYARLRTASRSVCNVGERQSLVQAMAAKSCYTQVLGAAVDEAKLPTLTALHHADSGRPGRS
jgi:UrcA family protein